MVPVSLKTKRVPTSRRAWSSALVSSAASNSETTSKENSATGRAEDLVQRGPHSDRCEGDAHDRADGEQRADPRGALVKRLGRWLVVRVRAVVQVIDALLPSPL